jgi:sialidase-1
MKRILVFLLVCLTGNLWCQKTSVLFESNQPGISCYRIPAICTAPNGDLIVTIDERVPSCNDLRGSKDINIVIRRSTDGGQTWLKTERIIDFPDGLSASDPSFIVDQETEEIFLFYNYMDLNQAPDIYRFQYVKSKDNGISWSDPVEITDQIAPEPTRKDFQFITSGNGIQTKDGLLLHTLVNLDKGVFIYGSDDHGATWKIYGSAIKPGDESKIIEHSNGEWMVNSRVNKAGLRYVHKSNDQGATWESHADSTLIDPSCNAALLLHSNGTLYFSNAQHKTKRKNLTIRKSIDQGQTWNEGSVIYPEGAAYSDMTLLKNGDIGIVYEKDDYQSVGFTIYKVK